MYFNKIKYFLFLLFTFITCKISIIDAQYFNGPNKPDYKTFDYKVYTSPHFEIYHYSDNDSLIHTFAINAEKWYQNHLKIFKDTFKVKNPIILYNNHADFQQTNAIMETIGVGTGGVTESLKNRVVLPIMESAGQTDHVLGHELVHAFQYHLLLSDDSGMMRSTRNIPLWMIEGMAEYLSIGSVDSHTSMWMRDALINNDFPTLEDMTRSYKYFPYRYGQAFWAFVTGLYGDSIIRPLFDLTTKMGYDKALDSLTHLNEKSFSNFWKVKMKEQYYSLLKDTVEKPVGDKLLYRKNAGAMNIAPSFSPDGNYIIFLSEKDLFTFDLYKYNLKKKKIRKVSSTVRNNKIDDFNYLESGGSWSPDGKKFCFVSFSKGRNRLLIIDVKKPRKTYEIDIPGVEAFSNPAWSPDGKKIIVTGLKNGITDIYMYNLEDKSVENITNDVYCNLMSSWSTDGKFIVYSTDEDQNDSSNTKYSKGYNICIFNLETKKKNIIKVFNGCDNLNPQFSKDNKSIYFVSDANGVRNLYEYSIDSSKVFRLTNLITGLCGITKFTPAISASRVDNNVIYTHYFKGDYNLYVVNTDSLKKEEVNPNDINMDLASLPPLKRIGKNIVNENIAQGIKTNDTIPADSFKVVPYRSKFQLDYIGGSSMGVAVSSYYGTGMAGSVDLLFGDMVGNYQLYSSLAINGQVQDFGGSVAFLNNKHKIDWGAAISHIPYKYGAYSYGLDTIQQNVYTVLNVDIQWIFEDALTLFAVKPLSQTQRIEASTSFSYYSYYVQRDKYITDGYSTMYVGREKNLPAPDGFGVTTAGIAYTLDNSYTGIASPLRGQRLRLEADQYFGKLNFTNVIIDFRKYIFLNPISLAFRLYHQGRYGGNNENSIIRSLYIGWPWLVRGFFDFISIDDGLSSQSQLFGSHIGVANFEVRIPFTGPERLCLIPFKYFISELALFTDMGIAWNSNNKLTLDMEANKKLKLNYNNLITTNTQSMYENVDYAYYRYPMITYGISLRINLFGYMVIEPYYAIPYMKNGKKYAGIRLNLLPGW